MQIATYLSSTQIEAELFCLKSHVFAAIVKNKEDAPLFVSMALSRFENPWSLGQVNFGLDALATTAHVPEDIDNLAEIEDLIAVNYPKSKTGSYHIPYVEVERLSKLRVYEEEINQAFQNGEFEVYFQPIYSIQEGKTVSAEALLRAKNGILKTLSPEIYVPVAEKTGLIRQIGLFVFEETCRFLSDPRTKASQIRYVELNLSPFQFLYEDLVESFEEVRKRYDVPVSALNLEITETGGTLENEGVLKALSRFKELGYGLSLDDFGTGYSNFVRMVEGDFENIKFDKSILWTLSEEEDGLKTLKGLMQFVKSQGFDIVQEGVESKEQLDIASSCGADLIQGFYFSKPIPKDDFFAYLHKEATAHSA